jgi:hypothetical protein
MFQKMDVAQAKEARMQSETENKTIRVEKHHLTIQQNQATREI